MTEHAIQRKLFRRIAAEVSQNEGMYALREYIYINLPASYNQANTSKPDQLAHFLANNKDRIGSIPGGVLDPSERSNLLPEKAEEFDVDKLNATTLAIIVKYLFPCNPGNEPDPTNSIWNTRLKLLGNATDLHYFIRLWRLWSKYQHNQQMNHSSEEIYTDFQTMQTAVKALITDKNSEIRRRAVRFQRFWDLIQQEKDCNLLKMTITQFEAIAKSLHCDQTCLEGGLSGDLQQIISNVVEMSKTES